MATLFAQDTAVTKRRRGIAFTIACGLVCLLAPRDVSDVAASTLPVCHPFVASATSPDPSGAPRHYAPAGAIVTVNGASLAGAGCSVQLVAVGGTVVDHAGVHVAANGSVLTFTAPPGAIGRVLVTDVDQQGRSTSSNDNVVFVTVPQVGLQHATPLVNTAMEVYGEGFSAFADTSPAGVPGAAVTAVFPSCQGGRFIPVQLVNDTTLRLAAPPHYCVSLLTLHFSAPSDTSRPASCAAPPRSPSSDCIDVAVPLGVVDPAFFVSSLSPAAGSAVSPGTVITAAGSGFGASGAAFLGGRPAPARWTDNAVAVMVPQGGVSGPLVLQRATGDALAVPVGLYSVAGGGTASGTARTAAAVAVVLTPVERSAPPGARIDLNAGFVIDGRPVSGAPATLTMRSAPGGDAALSSACTTDARGSCDAVIRLSSTPGRHVIAVRVGIYSGTTVLTGERPPVLLGGHLPLGLSGLHIDTSGSPVVVWLSLVAILVLAFAALVLAAVVLAGLLRVAVSRLRRRGAVSR